ncbi:uncharacterized protein LOC126895333 [Daktulosphaira vitifoliae]|uniref:uncharacterized protein LOC126895333 n=1 Tax=Daktulosphaira vitifoliae TaxID=58002 RepID=UPI0021AB059C|nr:uncharacterized protein LOC126895333 [Daktulosphaira vitifoliae]
MLRPYCATLSAESNGFKWRLLLRSGQTKEEVIETNERLRAVRIRLEESYDTAKKSLITLMTKYTESKSTRNVFQRYNLLKAMIKEVIRLETQYWTLVEIPKQEKQETVPSFVLRACGIVEKSQKTSDGVKSATKASEEEEKKRELLERLAELRSVSKNIRVIVWKLEGARPYLGGLGVLVALCNN